MASLVRAGWKISPHLLKQKGVLVAPIVRKNWNRDWKPAQYPTTEEERKAAAKKYGLLPEDYKPVPDDGLGAGDYPDLPHIGPEGKSEWDVYDLPDKKRNFGEPVHMHADMYAGDRFDPTFVPRVPYWQQLLIFSCLFILPFGIHLATKDYPKFMPVMPKQIPYSDEVHYTFEPIKNGED